MVAQSRADVCSLESSQPYRQEAEHRIANSLQLISAIVRQRARVGRAQNPQAFLLEIADRIETVGKLRQFLANSATDTVQLLYIWKRFVTA